MFPAGSDYNSTVQPLEFLTGDTQLPLIITIVDDSVLEETESFTVRLILTAEDINVILGPGNITRVVIRDNDGEKEVNGSLGPRPSSLSCAEEESMFSYNYSLQYVYCIIQNLIF